MHAVNWGPLPFAIRLDSPVRWRIAHADKCIQYPFTTVIMRGRPTARSVESVLRHRGVTGAAELRAALGVSQPTFSRVIAASGDDIVRIGAARSTRYALRHRLGSLGAAWPLYRIDERGAVHEVGRLHALEPASWWFESALPRPAWLFGEFAAGLFPGLPWFLDDLRPQGFMGRAFARTHGPQLGLDPDASRWSNDDVVVALLQRGHDLVGNFVLGRRLAGSECNGRECDREAE